MPTHTFKASIVLFTLLCGLLLSFPRSALDAQAGGSMAGTVVSVLDDEPLMGVAVTVLEGDFHAVTDEEGRFFFSDLPTGEVTMRVEFGGYSTLVERVIPTPAEVGVFQVSIAPIWASLSEIVVNAGPPRALTSSDIIVYNRDNKTALELLADQVPGVGASLGQSPVHSGSRIRLRGNNSITFNSVPAIYLDGIRVRTQETSGLQILDRIPASDIAGIRVLRGPSATGQYGDGAAGVILIETRGAQR